ncbi:DUF4364 family protein [Anaerolentibacter hominis]|uniref:DUF4364 family protein n=1 Tax=Anaerolentibacter hominis TaxID=3079009 RepID=UPI0031B7FAB3
MASSDTFTLYKLIILDMLNRVDFPLTNAQICNFILEKDYTNYFTVQQVLSEMLEAQLIHGDTMHHTSYYKITEAGKETLSFFGSQIPDSIRQDILKFFQDNKYSLKEEVSVLCDYYKEHTDLYMVRCKILENGTALIELNLTVPTEEEASLLCSNWKKKNKELYPLILAQLLNG